MVKFFIKKGQQISLYILINFFAKISGVKIGGKKNLPGQPDPRHGCVKSGPGDDLFLPRIQGGLSGTRVLIFHSKRIPSDIFWFECMN